MLLILGSVRCWDRCPIAMTSDGGGPLLEENAGEDISAEALSRRHSIPTGNPLTAKVLSGDFLWSTDPRPAQRVA